MLYMVFGKKKKKKATQYLRSTTILHIGDRVLFPLDYVLFYAKPISGVFQKQSQSHK